MASSHNFRSACVPRLHCNKTSHKHAGDFAISPKRPQQPPRVALVTGTLAAAGLSQIADGLKTAGLADATVVTLPIQVAALLTTPWLERKLHLPADQSFDQVILPGYCRGDLKALEAKLGVTTTIGPRDMRDLPEFFGRRHTNQPVIVEPDIEIIAEINHAATLDMQTIIDQAISLKAQGADVIDIGCDPMADRPAWQGLAAVVGELIKLDIRVSVDSFQPDEVASACAAGAHLVLSVNTTNAHLAKEWNGAQVVAIPDDPHTLAGLDKTLQILDRDGVAFRIDPILEPIGFGFAASLGRYLDVRQRYPDAQMMMGVGNLSEMTEVDSAGVNMLLAGFCQEQGIHSVLTTQVINWARSSVTELDIARRMVQGAMAQGRPPKHVDPRLVMLRDPKLKRFDPKKLEQMAAALTDPNIRLFAQDGLLHAMNRDFYEKGSDPFVLFDQMKIDNASHAFYLGYEMAKAVTAMTLSKNYMQDQSLNWGMHTVPEKSHHERRTKNKTQSPRTTKEGSDA